MSNERLTSERGDDGDFAILGQHGVPDGDDDFGLRLSYFGRSVFVPFCYRDTTFAFGEGKSMGVSTFFLLTCSNYSHDCKTSLFNRMSHA